MIVINIYWGEHGHLRQGLKRTLGKCNKPAKPRGKARKNLQIAWAKGASNWKEILEKAGRKREEASWKVRRGWKEVQAKAVGSWMEIESDATIEIRSDKGTLLLEEEESMIKSFMNIESLSAFQFFHF